MSDNDVIVISSEDEDSPIIRPRKKRRRIISSDSSSATDTVPRREAASSNNSANVLVDDSDEVIIVENPTTAHSQNIIRNKDQRTYIIKIVDSLPSDATKQEATDRPVSRGKENEPVAGSSANNLADREYVFRHMQEVLLPALVLQDLSSAFRDDSEDEEYCEVSDSSVSTHEAMKLADQKLIPNMKATSNLPCSAHPKPLFVTPGEACSSSKKASLSQTTRPETSTSQSAANTSQSAANTSQSAANTSQSAANTSQSAANTSQNVKSVFKKPASVFQRPASVPHRAKSTFRSAASTPLNIKSTFQSLANTFQSLEIAAHSLANTSLGRASTSQGLANTSQKAKNNSKSFVSTCPSVASTLATKKSTTFLNNTNIPIPTQQPQLDSSSGACDITNSLLNLTRKHGSLIINKRLHVEGDTLHNLEITQNSTQYIIKLTPVSNEPSPFKIVPETTVQTENTTRVKGGVTSITVNIEDNRQTKTTRTANTQTAKTINTRTANTQTTNTRTTNTQTTNALTIKTKTTKTQTINALTTNTQTTNTQTTNALTTNTNTQTKNARVGLLKRIAYTPQQRYRILANKAKALKIRRRRRNERKKAQPLQDKLRTKVTTRLQVTHPESREPEDEEKASLVGWYNTKYDKDWINPKMQREKHIQMLIGDLLAANWYEDSLFTQKYINIVGTIVGIYTNITEKIQLIIDDSSGRITCIVEPQHFKRRIRINNLLDKQDKVRQDPKYVAPINKPELIDILNQPDGKIVEKAHRDEKFKGDLEDAYSYIMLQKATSLTKDYPQKHDLNLNAEAFGKHVSVTGKVYEWTEQRVMYVWNIKFITTDELFVRVGELNNKQKP